MPPRSVSSHEKVKAVTVYLAGPGVYAPGLVCYM